MNIGELSLLDVAAEESSNQKNKFTGHCSITGCGDEKFWQTYIDKPFKELGVFGKLLIKFKTEGKVFGFGENENYILDIEPESDQDDIFNEFFEYFKEEFNTQITMFQIEIINETAYDENFELVNTDRWYISIHVD